MRGFILIVGIVVLHYVVEAFGAGGDLNYDKLSTLPSTLTLSDLEKAIEAKVPAFNSVETFLEWVKQNHPLHLSGFTLMNHSLSLQRGSETFPRAIVFGPDAKFIYTFNGHPKQAGYNAVEIIAFESTAPQSWQFREIIFSGESRPALSEANPAKCARCHYQPLRPIWEPYDQWPGAYGHDDDALIDFRAEKYAGLDKTAGFIAVRLAELDAFRRFKQLVPKHSRYRYLQFPEGSPVSPYNTVTRSGYQFRPNLRFTALLAPLQARHLANQIVADRALFRVFGPALTAGLIARCSYPYKALFADRLALSRTLFQKKLPHGNLATWARVGYVGSDLETGWLAASFGIEHTDFVLSRDPKNWSYYVGSNYLSAPLAQILFTELRKQNPNLPAAVAEEHTGELNLQVKESQPFHDEDPESASPLEKSEPTICDVLKKEDERNGPVEPIASTALLINPVPMCLSCHSPSNGSAPPLPLEKPGEFTSSFVAKVMNRVNSSDPKVRMPPERMLSEKEKQSLRLYLGADE